MAKPIERGTHVTVLMRTGPHKDVWKPVHAVVQSGRVARMTVWYTDTQTGKRRKYRVRDGDSEGTWWVRGWDSPAARALLAAVALQ